MPGCVGLDAFLSGLVDWIEDEEELDVVLTDIDEAWPR